MPLQLRREALDQAPLVEDLLGTRGGSEANPTGCRGAAARNNAPP